MGFQTPLSGDVRMTAEAARELLALGVDWSGHPQSFDAYIANGAAFDASTSTLRFALGWVTWPLARMMDVIAAMKDLPETDRLVHHQPTYDAWYATGTFFVEPGRWGYVGAGPMFDVATGGYTRPAHVGPEVPVVGDVRGWNSVGPLARSVRLHDDVWLAVETVRGDRFRCGTWILPNAVARALDSLDDGANAVRLTNGGTTLVFLVEDVEHAVDVRTLYDARDDST